MKKAARQDIDHSPHARLLKMVPPETNDLTSTILEHWLIVKPWWRRIAVATAVGFVFVYLMASFVMSHWYQASSIIRPASQQGPVSPLAMMLGSSPFSATLGSILSTPTGLSDQLPNDAAEYVDTLRGYEFTTMIVERHKLAPILAHKSLISRVLAPIQYIKQAIVGLFVAPSPPGPDDERFALYQAMQARFDIEYDSKQGSLTLSFLDRDPQTAKKILGFYINDLREMLRKRTIENTTAAIKSLQDELARTPDPLVQQQIAQLVAQQIQQDKTAQAQADFAFSVTDPPYVPSYPSKPNVTLLCLLVLILIPMMAFIGLEVYANVYLPVREADRASDLSTANGFDSSAPPDNHAEEPVSRPLN